MKLTSFGTHECSEDRFSLLRNLSLAIEKIATATGQFRQASNLIVGVAQTAQDIPAIKPSSWFKYISKLHNWSMQIEHDRSIIVVYVQKEVALAGYGLARLEANSETQIEIIDVDETARRSVGLSKAVTLEGQKFHVGIGHIIVQTLIDNCNHPIWTEATNYSSRYVFKSLGFIHDARMQNPCILRFE